MLLFEDLFNCPKCWHWYQRQHEGQRVQALLLWGGAFRGDDGEGDGGNYRYVL
jgi:hypothetical protein